jgi:hypothetical protein
MNKVEIDYLVRHNVSGIKVGDMVRVTRAAMSYEGGWGSRWSSRMSDYVGKKVQVIADRGVQGFRVKFGAARYAIMPYFVLEEVYTSVWWEDEGPSSSTTITIYSFWKS